MLIIENACVFKICRRCYASLIFDAACYGCHSRNVRVKAENHKKTTYYAIIRDNSACVDFRCSRSKHRGRKSWTLIHVRSHCCKTFNRFIERFAAMKVLKTNLNSGADWQPFGPPSCYENLARHSFGFHYFICLEYRQRAVEILDKVKIQISELNF